jgi:plasmid stability protein
MAQIFIQLEDAILVQLKRRAWEQGLPFEESLRRLLSAAASSEDEPEPVAAPVARAPRLREKDGGASSARHLICV